MNLTIQASLGGGGKSLWEFCDRPKGSFGQGHSVAGPGGAEMVIDQINVRLSADAGTIVAAVLSIPAGVAATLISQWLIKRLRAAQATEVTIDRKTVRLDEGEITEIIEEHIRAKM